MFSNDPRSGWDRQPPGNCPVNVGNPEEKSMLELAQTVIAATGRRLTICLRIR